MTHVFTRKRQKDTKKRLTPHTYFPLIQTYLHTQDMASSFSQTKRDRSSRMRPFGLIRLLTYFAQPSGVGPNIISGGGLGEVKGIGWWSVSAVSEVCGVSVAEAV